LVRQAYAQLTRPKEGAAEMVAKPCLADPPADSQHERGATELARQAMLGWPARRQPGASALVRLRGRPARVRKCPIVSYLI
jgi:hypothetical protein